MQEKLKESGVAKPTSEDYSQAEGQVEDEMKAREVAAQAGRKYSVDEQGVVLTDEERKQRIEEGPDSHATQR